MAIFDHFAGSDGDPLVGHLRSDGGTWIYTGQVGGSFSIQTAKAKGAEFWANAAVCTGTFSPNQYAQVVTKAIAGTSNYAGVLLRSLCEVRVVNVAGLARIQINDSTGYRTDFASGKASGVLFTLKASVSGNVVSVFVDGGADLAGGVTTVETGGSPGILSVWGTTDPTLDDFECSDTLVVSSTIGARFLRGATDLRSFGVG